MAKVINCVVDTKSKKERIKLLNYLAFDYAIFSMVDRNYEGFQIIAVFPCGVGCVGTIVAKNLVNNKDFRHFTSVSEFIRHCELD